MKKSVAILLISTVLCIIFAAAVPAFAEQTSGFCGAEYNNLTWGFDSESGELVISGEGEMMHLEMFEAPWDELKEAIKSVRIGCGVTSIGRFAFYEFPALETVVFEENSKLERIDFYAFYNCDLLTTVVIPDGVTYIDDSAFGHCDGLVSLYVPSSVLFIGINAFPVYAPNLECTELDGLKYIGNQENPYMCLYVASDKNITSATLHDDTKFILSEAFNYCMSMNSVELPAGLISIGSSAFRYCSAIKNIVIPEGVTYIGDHAFDGCRSITQMDIPSSVEMIESYAFYYCTGLTEMIIPETVGDLGTNVFSNCDLLESVTLFTDATKISSRLFEHCKALKTVKLIGGEPDVEYMFYGCDALEKVIYCGPLENFEQINASALNSGVTLAWHDLVESKEPIVSETPDKNETATNTATTTNINSGNGGALATSTAATTSQVNTEIKPYLCLVCGEIVLKEIEATSAATSTNTTAKTTTKTPSETKKVESETTEETVVSSETTVTEQTGSEGGCQSLLGGGAAIVCIVSLVGAMCSARRRED